MFTHRVIGIKFISNQRLTATVYYLTFKERDIDGIACESVWVYNAQPVAAIGDYVALQRDSRGRVVDIFVKE